MFRILEQQAPPKQTATDTIATLSGRLQSATLLEDRRTAILGLRSFAKKFPASVASGALRNLITSLTADAEDVDTTKVVLETLLALFTPDESSPEASDEISLWLADEFTQRQENITVLLDLLERFDFFSRLYSLQLLGAILSARPERTQECILMAPLGISRLVAILDDKREAIQSEAITLLISLTPASAELQKMVAFENAFDRIFVIIEAEGALTRGGIVVQDCLSLLANLLRLNVSNQLHFRETNGVPRAANLLQLAVKEESDQSEDAWSSPQKEKNIWGFLSVIRLFLQARTAATQMNQVAFWQHGATFAVLEIGFHPTMSDAIRSEALFTCADLIRANGSLQEKIALREISIRVAPEAAADPTKPQVNGVTKQPTRAMVNTIQAFMDVSLAVSYQEPIDIRLSACECLKAYVQDHAPIRHFFLQRAREGHLSAESEPDNIFTILIEDGGQGLSADPYRLWIASVVLFQLLYNDYDAKKTAMDIAEGDADKGEEVVTSIQAISANMMTSAQRGTDERITLAYLTLLCGWLFEDPEAINDFLQEGSNVQSLIQLVLQPNQRPLESGLCAFLLGIIYEFSSKDSPITRNQLHNLLVSALGREQYADKLVKLREHPYIRDFEILPQGYIPDAQDGQPEFSFDKLFIEFLKDNFSRISRALDREPGEEVSVITNGVQRGVSRELVDSLKAELENKNSALQKAQSTVVALEQKLGQEQAELRKARESSSTEMTRIKNINDGLQHNHELETRQLAYRHEQEKNQLQQNQSRALENQKRMAQSEIDRVRREYQKMVSDAEANVQKLYAENQKTLADSSANYDYKLASLEREKKNLRKEQESALAKAAARHQEELVLARQEHDAFSEQTYSQRQNELRSLRSEHENTVSKLRSQHQQQLEDLTTQLRSLENETGQASHQHSQALEIARGEQTAQIRELEDLLQNAESRVEEARKEVLAGAQADQDNRIMELQRQLRAAEADAEKPGAQAMNGAPGYQSGDLQALEEQLRDAEARAESFQEEAADAIEMAIEGEEFKDFLLGEIDDLWLLLADREVRRIRHKKRLKSLGEEVSDGESDEDEDEREREIDGVAEASEEEEEDDEEDEEDEDEEEESGEEGEAEEDESDADEEEEDEDEDEEEELLSEEEEDVGAVAELASDVHSEKEHDEVAVHEDEDEAILASEEEEEEEEEDEEEQDGEQEEEYEEEEEEEEEDEEEGEEGEGEDEEDAEAIEQAKQAEEEDEEVGGIVDEHTAIEEAAATKATAEEDIGWDTESEEAEATAEAKKSKAARDLASENGASPSIDIAAAQTTAAQPTAPEAAAIKPAGDEAEAWASWGAPAPKQAAPVPANNSGSADEEDGEAWDSWGDTAAEQHAAVLAYNAGNGGDDGEGWDDWGDNANDFDADMDAPLEEHATGDSTPEGIAQTKQELDFD